MISSKPGFMGYSLVLFSCLYDRVLPGTVTQKNTGTTPVNSYSIPQYTSSFLRQYFFIAHLLNSLIYQDNKAGEKYGGGDSKRKSVDMYGI
jgi:hypothetical protein